MGRHRHLTALAGAVCLATVSACAPPSSPPSAEDGSVSATYDCGTAGRLAVVFAGDTATIVFADGKHRTLSRAISASGARYTDGSMTFWDRGQTALFGAAFGDRVDCLRVSHR